jgi:hypothetical protein
MNRGRSRRHSPSLELKHLHLYRCKAFKQIMGEICNFSERNSNSCSEIRNRIQQLWSKSYEKLGSLTHRSILTTQICVISYVYLHLLDTSHSMDLEIKSRFCENGSRRNGNLSPDGRNVLGQKQLRFETVHDLLVWEL